MIIIKAINAAFLSLIFCINLIFFEDDRLINWITPAPAKEEVYIEERGLLMDIYAPRGKSPRSKMLIIHGATEFGKEDLRLIRICDLLARMGLKLYVPNIRELMQWNLGTTGVDDIIHIYKNYLTDDDKIKRGMLSYSVGCAVLFIAGSDNEISSDIDYLISFGGYYDTKNVLLFMTTGYYKEEGEWKRYAIKKDIDKIFLERNLYMVKEEEEREIVRRIMAEGPKEDLMNSVSEETKNLVSMIYNRDKDIFYRLYEGIDPSVKDIFENVAPKNYLKNIKSDCYIAHSVPDFVIPHTESDLLAKGLGNKVKGYYKFRFFRHVERKFEDLSVKKIVTEYIPDAIKFYIFIYKMLML